MNITSDSAIAGMIVLLLAGILFGGIGWIMASQLEKQNEKKRAKQR